MHNVEESESIREARKYQRSQKVSEKSISFRGTRKLGRNQEVVYEGFAEVYDELMDNVPYEQWCRIIAGCIEEYGVSKVSRSAEAEPNAEAEWNAEAEPNTQAEWNAAEKLESERDLVVDLGCGTGVLTRMMYAKGYDMIGVDASQEMLQVAVKKRTAQEEKILYLHQDMRELELYSTVGTIFSVCDSLNYILEEEELLQVFCLVDNYLYPGGLFLFDFNTVYKYEQVIGEAVIAENREEVSFIWENYYDSDSLVNECELTLFCREEDGRFRRFTETHYQRGYTIEQMQKLIEAAGMQVVKVLDGESFGEAGAESERIFMMAKECRKGGA